MSNDQPGNYIVRASSSEELRRVLVVAESQHLRSSFVSWRLNTASFDDVLVARLHHVFRNLTVHIEPDLTHHPEGHAAVGLH